MTFDSILLKLLPFSYIDLKTQEVHFDLTYPCNLLSDGDKIITFVEVLLIFLFVFYFVKLIFSWLKDRRQINILRKLLIKHRKNIQLKNPNTSLDISEEYPELLEEINNSNPRLQKLWKEFDESLIKKTDGEKFIIRNSIDAEYFFNKGDYLRAFEAAIIVWAYIDAGLHLKVFQIPKKLKRSFTVEFNE